MILEDHDIYPRSFDDASYLVEQKITPRCTLYIACLTQDEVTDYKEKLTQIFGDHNEKPKGTKSPACA